MAAHQAPPSLGFSRQEHWSGLPFPSPMHESGKWKVKVKSLSCVQLSVIPWTAAYQAPPTMGFSRQEYWSGLPLPSPGKFICTLFLDSTRVVKSPSRVQLFATPWTVAHQASLSLTISWSLPKFRSIASVMPSSHLILWRPDILLPSIFPSIQGLFQWVSCLHQMTKILEFQLQHQSFQWVFRVDPLRLTGLIPLLSKGLSGVFPITTVRRHQFFDALPSLWSNSHIHTCPLGRPQPWLYAPSLAECFSTHCLGLSWLSCQEDAKCKQYRIMFVFLYLTYFIHYDNLFIMWSLLSSSASVCFSEHTSFLFYLPSQIQYWFFIVTCHTFWYLFSRILSGIFFFYFYISFEILNLSKTTLPVLYKIE